MNSQVCVIAVISTLKRITNITNYNVLNFEFRFVCFEDIQKASKLIK